MIITIEIAPGLAQQLRQEAARAGLAPLARACQGCNSRKYVAIEALDPVTGETVPLYHPRRDRWLEHFAWNEDDTLIIGLTPTGRTTVEKL